MKYIKLFEEMKRDLNAPDVEDLEPLSIKELNQVKYIFDEKYIHLVKKI